MQAELTYTSQCEESARRGQPFFLDPWSSQSECDTLMVLYLTKAFINSHRSNVRKDLVRSLPHRDTPPLQTPTLGVHPMLFHKFTPLVLYYARKKPSSKTNSSVSREPRMENPPSLGSQGRPLMSSQPTSVHEIGRTSDGHSPQQASRMAKPGPTLSPFAQGTTTHNATSNEIEGIEAVALRSITSHNPSS